MSEGRWHILLDGSSVPTREEAGNKARGVALMRSRGLPVPPAFVLSTHVGRRFVEQGGTLPEEAWAAALEGIRALESATGRTFGSGPAPLLVSVRSGAAQSMPGMMDTILNLGMNDDVEAALAAESGDPAFAADTHRRFVESYEKTVKAEVPSDPHEQLRGAICAVFASWMSPRAKAYRRHWEIPEEGGTAVTVQAMVFGNLDDASGTGVYFTRNPHSGASEPYGEFLPRGQGEDVVSGEVQPLDLEALRERLPEVHAALLEAGRTLERDAGDVQDVEFTVERGRLYLLQTRNAKRSPEATIRLAVDLVNEGLTTPEMALAAVRAEHIAAVLQPAIDPEQRRAATVLARGEPACPGIASGLAVGDADDAVDRNQEDEPVILVRRMTSPEDVHGMIASEGVVTEIGGRTSHAAVVSRELGRPAVVGCGEGTLAALLGQVITIDGATGEVFAGALATRHPEIDEHPRLSQLIAWAEQHREAIGDDHPLLDMTAHRAGGTR
jgi:pyruvate,orthophosphate dikinase